MSGFNDRKAIDELYKSGKYQDETDNQLAQGSEEVGRLSDCMIYSCNYM